MALNLDQLDDLVNISCSLGMSQPLEHLSFALSFIKLNFARTKLFQVFFAIHCAQNSPQLLQQHQFCLYFDL
jgi:hypothetical protein